MQTIAVFPNPTKACADQVLRRVVKFFQDKDVRLLLPQKVATHFGYEELGVAEIAAVPLDLALTIGGDGTLLGACRKVAPKGVPVCGINIGRLGFLADIELGELESKLEKILWRDYRLEERLMLDAFVRRGGAQRCIGHAINDVVVNKGGVARMLALELFVDDAPVDKYEADGLIVSTATGSTGYSLSAGGPIINPRVKVLLITPICPHTLNGRPLLIAEEETVRIRIGAQHEDILLSFDGQDSERLLPGDEVLVRKAPLAAKIVKFEDKNYYLTMREKLWGR